MLAAVTFPWLNPVAGGPSAMMEPWLVAAAATVLIWHFIAPGVTRWQFGLALAAAALLAGIGEAAPPVLLAIGGLMVIAISAAVATAATTRVWLRDAIVNAW